MITSKVCTKCGVERPLSEFYVNRNTKTGKFWYRTQCKKCSIETARKRQIKGLSYEGYHRHYLREHPEYAGNYNWRVKSKALRIVGTKCVYCGEANPLILSINHKNGGGNSERKALKLEGNDLYRMIVSGKRKTDDLETCCMNCQVAYEVKVGRRWSNIRSIVEPLLQEYYGRKRNV